MAEKGVMFDMEESQGDWFDFFESKVDLATGNIIYDDPKPGTGRVCFRPSRPLVMERVAKRKKESEFVLIQRLDQWKKLSLLKLCRLKNNKKNRMT